MSVEAIVAVIVIIFTIAYRLRFDRNSFSIFVAFVFLGLVILIGLETFDAKAGAPNIHLSQTRVRAAHLLGQTHLRRQGVAQAIDFVFQLAEKGHTALLRGRDFADDPAVGDAQIFLAPFDSAEIAAR